MRGCVQRRPGMEAAGRGGETMDETEELIELCVRSLAAQMIGGPGVELYMTRRCILGLTDEALADFSGYAAAHAWRGRVLCTLDRCSQARRAFERALALDPDDRHASDRTRAPHV